MFASVVWYLLVTRRLHFERIGILLRILLHSLIYSNQLTRTLMNLLCVLLLVVDAVVSLRIYVRILLAVDGVNKKTANNLPTYLKHKIFCVEQKTQWLSVGNAKEWLIKVRSTDGVVCVCRKKYHHRTYIHQ